MTENATADVASFIRERMPLTAVPGRPDLRLHRATPASGLGRLAAADAERFGSPYWAYAWGGGLALALHLAAEPGIVAGRSVLDLGAGSGLVAIAAARAGARSVLAADTDAYAVQAIPLNAAANGVDVKVVARDLTAGDPPNVEVVLVGDLFYARDLAERVTGFLARCRAAGALVLVGDPGRAFLPLDRLTPLAEYPVADFGDAPAFGTALGQVFAFD
ncbi:class I SAM-dependent methyltransferase [Caulobacter sp. KR2-114]|uniref:class I SAM-dependent methyltransferase n=1 Tax=Caulobacter sp. KR2-114 TaxID=3400912 RepID=UPI003BFE1F5A